MAKLSVIAGTPVPISSLGMELHQPTIKEIAAIGEREYFSSLGLFMKSDAEEFKRITLEDQKEMTFDEQRELEMELSINFGSDFLVFQYLANTVEGAKKNVESLFYTIFQRIKGIEWIPRMGIQFKLDDHVILLDENSFKELKDTILTVLDYESESEKENGYKAANSLAQEIIDKINKAKEKRQKEGGARNESESALADLCSILASSSNTSLLDVLNLTYPQLVIQHERSSLLLGFTNQIRASVFGGLKSEDIIDWTKSI